MAEEAQEPEEAPAAAAPDDGEEPPAPEKKTKTRANYTALEIAEQVHEVQEWLSHGIRPNLIRRLCADKWDLCTRSAENRMQAARRQMVLDVNTYDRKEMAAKMLQSLEKVMEQALLQGQGSNAIGAMRLQCDLLQLINRGG